jgi:hypothetical protein
MKLIFHSPKKASLSIIKGVFEKTNDNEWIGPRALFHWVGYPKKCKIKKNNLEKNKLEKLEKVMSDIINVCDK